MAGFDPKEWTWWQACLKARDEGRASEIGSKELPITEEPMQGFYRMRSYKDGPFVSVAVWYQDGQLMGLKNGVGVEEPSIRGFWSYCAPNPISHRQHEDFLASKKNPATPNGVWFDEVVAAGKSSHVADPVSAEPVKRKPGRPRKTESVAAVAEPKVEETPVVTIAEELVERDEWGDPIKKDAPAEEVVTKPAEKAVEALPDKAEEVVLDHDDEEVEAEEEYIASAENERAVIGDNSRSAFDQLKDDAEEWQRTVDKLVKDGVPTTQAQADKLADAKSKLGDLWKEIEAMRVEEKRPHMDAANAVQQKYRVVLDPIEGAGNRVVGVLNPFLKKQRDAEAARVAEINRKAREEAEAERAALKAKGEDVPEVVVHQVKAQSVGAGNRRKVSSVNRQIAVVKDPKAAMAFFGAQEPIHEDFMALLKKFGKKMMDAGVKVPGIEMGEEIGVR